MAIPLPSNYTIEDSLSAMSDYYKNLAMTTPTTGAENFSSNEFFKAAAVEPVATTTTATHQEEERPYNLYGGAEPLSMTPSGSSSPTYSGYNTSGSSIPWGSTSTWQPAEGATTPTMGEYPEYMTPEIDTARISELTELGMGGSLGRLKEGLNSALLEARYSSNPNVRALATKSALSGYGQGITEARTGAHTTAMQEYAPEYQAAVYGAQATQQSEIQRIMAQFSADLDEYYKTGSQVTTPTKSLGTWGNASASPSSPFSYSGTTMSALTSKRF